MLAGLAAFPSSAFAQLQTYGLNQTTMFQINTTTGAGTSVRVLTGPNKAALAQRASDGLLFFITGVAGNDSVFTWNPAVPATAPVFIGRTGAGIPYLPRFGFSQGGTLYAVNTTTTRLYTINQTTGAATAIGAALTGAGTFGGDMAFAPNGTLYMMLGTNLYTVPLGGGAITLVGAVTGFAGTATGMAFDARGRLLVSNSATPAIIYVVPLAAGAATALGSAGSNLGDLGSALAVDLRITKTHVGSFSQGQTAATYTITVRDSGNVATSGVVTVTDTLPAGLTPTGAAGAGWTCPVPVGQVVTCTRADALASSGAYPAITLTLNVSGTAPAAVTNTARVSGGGEPPGNPALTGNNAAADPTAITGQPELTITKTHAGNFTVGVNGVYTLTVTNNGRGATAGIVTVTDNLPAGLTFVSGVGAGWACSAVGQLVTCTSAAAIAASGGTSAIALTVGVGAAAAPSVVNAASVSGGGEPAGNTGNNTSAGDVTIVQVTADLSTSKTDGVTAVNQGAALNYTIVVSNAGPSAVTGATVTDNFPAQLAGVTWTCAASAGSSCPASGGGNIAAAVNLLSGGTATFTATGTVTAGSGTITNTASIAAPAGVTDPPGNNAATDNDTQITPTANLAITKTDGVTAVNQGAALTYTIVASNAGPSAVIGATVTDNFPAQLSGVTWTCAASAGSSCPASGGGNIAAAVNLLNAGTATFTATGTVTGAGTITNVATVAAPAGVNDPAGNNSATDNDTQITPTADLAITKTDGVTGVNQGAPLTYTIVVSNAGPSAVTAATVTDNFPAQIAGVTWTCAASAGSSCPAGGGGNIAAAVNLLSGGTATFTATGTVTGTGTITNVATVTAPAGVNDPAGNNSATDNDTQITATADLAITKTDGVTAVNQGAGLTYTIVVSNAGPVAVTGATVSDAFPAQLSGVTWTCAASAGSSCPASGSGTIAAAVNLLNGGTATFTATGTVTAGSGTITNTASVAAPAGINDPAGNNNATDNDTQITPTADLAVTKTDGVTAVIQGAGLTYTIVVSNGGPSAVTGAIVTDNFPGQLSGVTWTCAASAGSSCPASGGGNLNAAINLLTGGTATFTATATATGTGTITNVATVTAPAGVNDPAGNNSATDNDTQITPTADLAITKTDGLTTVTLGAGLTYTIVASNAGPSAVTGATVSDVFPAELSGMTWTCAASAGSSCPASGSGNLNAAVDLLVGGTATFTASGTVTGGAATMTNTASVTAPAGVNDPAGNNSATDNDTEITPTADLGITKTDGVTTVNQGATLTYTILVSNGGPVAVTGATVSDVFPAQLSGVTWTCAASAGSSCPASGSGNIAAAIDLLNGGTATFTAMGTVTPGSGTMTNTATVTAPAGIVNDPPGNNAATDNDTQIIPTADLAITKTDGLTTVSLGAGLTYTIVASNAGPSAVTGATVSDVFPAELSGMTWTCAASAGSSCPASGSGNLNAAVDLLVGGTATFTASGTVTGGAATMTNTASVTAPAGVNDPAGNNSATDNDTDITPTADLAVTKTDGVTAVNQGATLTYTIVVSNGGPAAVIGATVTDNFPGQLSGVTWTCAASAGSTCPASGSGNIAAAVDLLNGGIATFTATATATGTGTITNVATATAPAGIVNDPAGNNAGTDNDTQIIPTADLTITKTDGVTGVNQGASLTYTIVVTNAGPSGVTGASVTDNFPGQLSGVTWTCAASAGSSCPASGSGNIAAAVDLLTGGTATFTATGTVTGAGTITNVATVTAPAGVNDPAGNNSATDNDTQITPTADLAITKTDGVAAINQGAALTYTIVASNAGPSAVTGATVGDVFPAQLSGVNWTCVASAGSSCPASGSGNLSAAVDLLTGGTATFTATGTVTGAGTITNVATVTAPAGVNDPAGNNSATDNDTQITPTADLAITKTDGITGVNQGDGLTYTIVVSNGGPSAVTGATVGDVFPAQLSGVNWTCVASAGSSCPASGSGNIAAAVDLLNGGTATFTATATVTGTGTITNVATVTAPAGVNDPAGNNSATDNDTQITATADLGITKTDGVIAVNQGASLAYTLVVSNAGPVAVTGATVSDAFPAQLSGVTWTCAASAGSSCPASGSGNLNVAVDLLAAGTATFTATGTVTGAGTITNVATVTAPAGINDPAGNNSATDNDTQITPTADLAITKTDGVIAVNQGAGLTYTVVVSNAGLSAVTGATVSDVFPGQLSGVNWTCAASAGSSCPASGSGNIAAAVDLLNGGTATFTATGTVTAGSGTITNTASVAGPAGVNDPAGNNAATDNNTQIIPTADLAITKTDGLTTVSLGAGLTYTIVASNAGPSAVTGATVSDAFPVELSGVTWTCAASAGSSCPASGSGALSAAVDLLVGGTATFTATGTVTGGGGGTMTNTASVTAPAGVNDPAGNNSATDNDTDITPTADLAITKTDGVTAVNQGASLTYTIVVSNAGPVVATGATVSDVFPAQLAGVTWTCAASAGSSCPASGSGDIAASVDLLNGGTATFTVTGTVTAPSGTITNVATVTAPAGINDPVGNNAGTDNDTQITPTADLAITKIDGVTGVNQGASLTYTIVVSNAGPSGVTGASVTDNFPAQLSGVNWTCAASAGSSCPASGSGNIAAAVDLLTGGTATFTATGTATGAGTITNVATVTAPAGVNDPAGNNSATDNDTQITATADLAITKTDGVVAVNQGASLIYTIVVSNAGPSAVTGATVTDNFPAQLGGVSWTCAASAGSSCPASGSGNLSAAVDLLLGGTATFTATGTGTGAGTITNVATVTAPAGINDPAGNNSATDNDTQITPTADLAITKTDGLTGVNQGDGLTYTIVVSNAGLSAVTGATVNDVFPAQLSGVNWTCAASAGSSCPASGSGDIAASVDLLSGGAATFTATGTVTAGSGAITNTASVTAPAGVNDPAGNNSATDNDTQIAATADLAITKTDGLTAVDEGAGLTYTIVVSNAGPSAVTGATVSDIFPAQLGGVTWTCAASAGSSCPASGSGDLNAAVDLLAGGTATFTATATVTGTGTITNVATVTAPAGVNDPAGNNSATDDDTQVTTTADLAITKTDGVTAVDQGATLTYTIVVSNAGPSVATGATVGDVFPAQLSGASWTCVASGESSCPASGSGNLNAAVDVLPGQTITFTVTGTVTGTGTITNVATVTAPAGVNDPAGDNSATDNDTQITPTADLAITKTDGVTAVNQGASLTYTIVVSNTGPAAVTGATVSDAFPAQLAGVTWTCVASAGSSCPASGGGNIAAAVDLLNGGTATFTATGTVTGAGTITNVATVTAPAGVNDPAGNNSATDNDTQITPTADLAITKTDGVTGVNQGAALTYTIVATNAGPSAVTGASVTDNFPAQLSGVTWTCAASAGSSCPASGSGNLAAAVNLLSGGTATFTATGTVTGTGTITNVATVTAPAGMNDPAGNNAATDNDTQVTGTADLAITKTDGVTAVNQDAALTYTIVVSNAGPSAVTAASVTDNFPAQLGGVTWTCAASAGSSCPASGSGNIAAAVNLLNGGTATFTATGIVTGTGTITNVATVTAPAGVNDPAGNNSATDSDTQITPTADLAITKTDGVTGVNQSAGLTYTIVVTNAGPSAVTSATVTDNFPAQLAGVTWTCAASAGSSCPASGSGNLAAAVNLLTGGTATFMATGTVTGTGTITNVATVTAPAGVNDPAGNNAATDNDTQVTGTADLAITKTDGVTAVNQGASVTYTIVVSNAGPVTVTGAAVSDAFPAQLSGVTWTCAASAGSSCPASGGGNIAAAVNLLNGGTATFTATGTVTGTGTITNVATVTAPAGINDPAGNNSATDNDTQITPTADLAITKTDGVTAVNQGASLTYTVVVSNAGLSAVTGATVSDVFPGQLSGVSWTCAASAGSSCPASGGGNIAAAVNLLNGGTATFTATGTVTGAGTITNVATVTAPAGVNDPAGNNSATDNDTQITATADLAITKTDGLTTVTQGGSLTYTIVVSNAGPSGVTGATVSDVFPAQLAGVTWTCTAAAGSSCPASGSGNLNAAVDLLAGGTATFTATATVTGAGTITNVATVTAPAGVNDPTGNNAATDNTTGLSGVDLALGKTHSGAFVVGTNGVYTITATNVGVGATSGLITVADTLPAGLGFVSAGGAGWTCGAVTQAVTCTNAGPLAPAASSTITLTVSVAVAAAPGVTNVATVSTSGDGNATNNTASDPTTVNRVDLSVTKSHTGTFTVGASGLYTITVTNVGTAGTTGSIAITDTLPAGMTFTSGSGPGWACAAGGQVVTCTSAGPLAPAASSSVTLTVGVGVQAYPSTTNAVSVATPGDSSSGGNNTAVDAATIVTFAYRLAVDKQADRQVVELAEALGYRVVVRAVGDSGVPDVLVDDALPSGFAYVAGTARLDGVGIADPTGAPGPRLTFPVGAIAVGDSVTLTYRVLVGAGALRGDGINRVQAVSGTVSAMSNMAVARVHIEGGVFTDRGIIVGKVFIECDCEGYRSLRQDREEVGVPGVRVYLEDGTSTLTDVEGKYNFYGVSPRLHVLKVDWATLPAGAQLVVVDNRNAGSPTSRFVDLKNGELHKANFAVLRTPAMLAAVHARRAQGEVFGVVADTAVGAISAPPKAGGGAAPAGVIAGTYEALLPPQTLTAANSGLPAVPLRADSLVAPKGHQAGRIELSVPRTPIPADGVTRVTVGVRVLDARGSVIPLRGRITLEASLGRWLVQDIDLTEPGVQAELAQGRGTFLLVASPQAGAGELRATVGDLSRTEPIIFVPAARPLLAVGVVQARFSLRSLTEGALTPVRAEDGFEEQLDDLAISADGGDATAAARGALYLRGKVQGKYLLALSFDSERDGDKRLFRDIQPEEFYPVYGDASIKEFDTQSSDRLYVRVDRERSFLLYGDYVTPSGGETRLLSAYDRTQTGVHHHLETARAALDVFASRGRLTQVVEEIPGLGISGPYALRRTDGQLNTDKVEILTRDRNQPSLILRTEPQARFADYTLEPFTGRLLFRAPVPSRDANLNPVSIRVTYEVDEGGDAFWNYGLVGRARVVNGIELGGTFAREENPLDPRSLVGVNSTLRLGAGTYLFGEFAQSNDSVGRGEAGRVELRHHSRWLDARLFATRSDSAFANPSSTFGLGRGEYGLRAALSLDRRTRILGEALRTEDIVSGGRRDGALLSVERRFGDRVVAELGYRLGEETSIPADSATLGASPNRTSAIRSRLSLQLLDRRRASVFGEFEQDLLETQQRRGAVGGEFLLARRARLYGRYERSTSFAGPYALNGVQRLATTVVGVDADYLHNNQVFSEYRARDAFSGREAEAAIGLRNRLPLGPGLVVNTSFERVQPIRGGGQEATAVTGAVEYTRDPLSRATARVELRAAPGGDTWLGTLGYARKVSRDLTLLGRAMVHTVGSEQTRARTQLGLAVRQTDVDTWNGLARYEYRYERLALTGAPLTSVAMHIVSAQVNAQPSRVVTLSGRYAGKSGSDAAGGVTTNPSAHLFAGRGLVDLTERWDVALTGSMLGSEGFRGREYGLGAELGRRMATNLRLAVGYNVFGFRDDDLSGVHSTTRGLYLDIGMKFDEGLLGGHRGAAAPTPARP